MNNLVGNTIDHYQILVKIRETPTRVLYKTYNTKAHNYTALEVVKTAGIEPSELLRLINDQVHKNAELTHPNIATVTDTGLYEGLIYIVYNFSPTHPLRRFFNRTYPWQEMARELVSITHALAYAHEKGIIHGALHPASIVLDEKRNPILFDFGFERLITDHMFAHAPGTWINRWGFEYRAPEQLSGAAPDQQSDIYAMGIMLHEWLIGKIPLLDATVLGTLQMRTTPSKAKASKETTPVPPVVQNLIQKCIALNPADRYQSMQEVYIVLARGALDMTITKKMVRKPLAIPVQRFNTGRLFAMLGVVVMLAISAIVFTNKSGSPAKESATPIPAEIQATPTQVVAKPTTTPTQAVITIETPRPNALTFPVFQETPISSVINQTINTGNINQMVMLGLWGIGDVNRLVSAPDGQRIAAASSIGIFIFDAQNLKLEKYIDTRSWVTAIDFSPDSKIIATGDRDGLIQLWNTDTWQEFEAPYSGHTKAILDLAFSPNGTKLASVAVDNTLIQWQLYSADNQEPARTPVNEVTAVAYSADNTRIITGGNDFKINIWDAGNLAIQQTTTSSSKIVDIASIKESSLFVIGGSDQKVALLDIAGTANLIPLDNLQYSLTGVAASPKGQLIAGGDINGGITVWDNKGTVLWQTQNYAIGDTADLNVPGSPHSLAFSPDGKSIFSGLHNGIIRSLNADTGAEVQQNQSLNAHARKLVFSHDSQYLITQHDNNLLTIWDLWNGTPLYQRQGEIKAGDPFSQNDRMFAVASSPSTVRVYNPANGDEIYILNGHRDLATIQFINNDAQLVAGYDQLMHLWSMSSGQELRTIRNYEGKGCSTIYDLNEQPIFSITNYHHVISNEQNSPGLCNFQKLDWTIFINEASGLIAYGGNSKLTVINTRNANSESQELSGVNRKNIVSVAISPNGDLIAAAYDDHTIHVWDAATRDELISLYGHSNSITDLRFTPDGKILISTSLDGTIRLWGVPY